MTKLLLTALAALVLAGCSCSEPKPRDPHWTQEACNQCRMAISEERYATQIVGPGMAWHHYDDLGCALKDLQDRPELQAGKLYVRVSGVWMPADAVKYAEGFATPMGYGYAPAKEGTLSIDDVRAALKRKLVGRAP